MRTCHLNTVLYCTVLYMNAQIGKKKHWPRLLVCKARTDCVLGPDETKQKISGVETSDPNSSTTFFLHFHFVTSSHIARAETAMYVVSKYLVHLKAHSEHRVVRNGFQLQG